MIENEDVPRRAIQARTTAVGTGLAVEELREFLAHGAGLGFAVASLEVRDDAFESMSFFYLHATRIFVIELNLLAAATEQHDVT